MLIVTRHGMFSIVSTKEITEDNFVYGEEDTVEIRSMSADDIFSLVTDFIDIIGEFEVLAIRRGHMLTTGQPRNILSKYRNKDGMMYSVTIPSSRWVTVIAHIGAGVTYTNFEDELQLMIDEGEKRASPLLILVRSIYTMATQLYSPFTIKKNRNGEVIH